MLFYPDKLNEAGFDKVIGLLNSDLTWTVLVKFDNPYDDKNMIAQMLFLSIIQTFLPNSNF